MITTELRSAEAHAPVRLYFSKQSDDSRATVVGNGATISSPLRSLITYIRGTVFNYFNHKKLFRSI